MWPASHYGGSCVPTTSSWYIQCASTKRPLNPHFVGRLWASLLWLGHVARMSAEQPQKQALFRWAENARGKERCPILNKLSGPTPVCDVPVCCFFFGGTGGVGMERISLSREDNDVPATEFWCWKYAITKRIAKWYHLWVSKKIYLSVC